MVRGKHGFERIRWAFKNILNHAVTWLLYDLNGKNDGLGPIAQHQPKIKSVKPERETRTAVRIPEPTQDIQDDDYDVANELLEWLSLATMCSPRIQHKDKIDTYLSRYRVPGSGNPDGEPLTCTTQDLVIFRWHGFITATFIKTIVLDALKVLGESWFGMTVAAFDGKAYAILQRKHHTMTWEYMD
jgi:ribonuclease P/MRP protein subunit RPP40